MHKTLIVLSLLILSACSSYSDTEAKLVGTPGHKLATSIEVGDYLVVEKAQQTTKTKVTFVVLSGAGNQYIELSKKIDLFDQVHPELWSNQFSLHDIARKVNNDPNVKITVKKSNS